MNENQPVWWFIATEAYVNGRSICDYQDNCTMLSEIYRYKEFWAQERWSAGREQNWITV